MGLDPETTLRRTARHPRATPDVDLLWRRGRRRRRARRTVVAGALAAVAAGAAAVIIAVLPTDSGTIGPIGTLPQTMILDDVDALTGSGGTVWALRHGQLVHLAPNGAESTTELAPDTCDLVGGSQGWVVALPCGDGPAVMVGPDLSTRQLEPTIRGLVGVGTAGGDPWLATADGRVIFPDDARRTVDLGGVAIAATTADEVIWVAVTEPDGTATLARVEDGRVAYRVPLSVTPTDITAAGNDIWILGSDRAVRADPTTNQEVQVLPADPGSRLVTGTDRAWSWLGDTATPLNGHTEVPIPAGATALAISADRFYSLVGDEVVATPAPG